MTIEEFFYIIGKYTLQEYFSKFGEIEQNLKLIEQNFLQDSEEKKYEMLERIADLTETSSSFCRLHVLSFCMKVSGDSRFTERLLEEILAADYDEVGEYNKLSHFWQIETAVFQNMQLGSPKTELLLAQLYKQLFSVFAGSFGLSDRDYIPVQERNRDLVFVFTSQVLGMEHAPTKTLLDRCYVLQKHMHKKVYIVNTAMQIPWKGQAPFYRLVNAEYAEELSGLSQLEFCGEKFDFYQCENKMPDLEIMARIIRLVKQKKPLYLVDIGGSDICADLCGLFVPQITVSTVFSKLAISCGEYQMIDKDITIQDKGVLDILGISPEKVKRTMFTFSFKEQTHHFTREQLGLPSEKFILLVVGWRLDEEIDPEFLDMLEQVITLSNAVSVAFMGVFHSYEERLEGYPNLKKNSVNLGKQMDALAVTECCDLYVNPKRNGGGSSAAEALYMGVPAVTLPAGDAFVAAGEEFGVMDFQEMEKQILRYYSDKGYYTEMVQRAKNRAKLLVDSNSSFGKTLCEIEHGLV